MFIKNNHMDLSSIFYFMVASPWTWSQCFVHIQSLKVSNRPHKIKLQVNKLIVEKQGSYSETTSITIL